MSTEVAILGMSLALIVGAAIGFFLFRMQNKAVAADAETKALAREKETEIRCKELIEQARRDAERITKDAELKAKDDFIQRREKFNAEIEQTRNEIHDRELKLEKREATLDARQKEIGRKEKSIETTRKKVEEQSAKLEIIQSEGERLIAEEMMRLQAIAGMNRESAEQQLFVRLEEKLSAELAIRIQKHEESIKATVEVKAREHLATAIQRFASAHTADATVSTVDIPSDDIKGRIIGREGRNIRTFEKLTGVDVIVDDTPGVVIVSAFDNVRREVARLSLQKLIVDGRIHPTRIEEVVQETQKEIDLKIMEYGRNAVQDAGIANLHEKLVHLLGRLRFRTSYSQNVLVHSLEVCHLTGMMAAELGLDAKLARRCALLHDIGKAADHEMEGGHPKIGAELAKRYGETNKDVLHAIAGHHDDITVDHIYTVLVAAADAISASRPGARRETLEKYVKRLEELEALACGFPGVDQAFAIQAGRELRIIANSEMTTDAEAIKLGHDIARAIEQQLDYPGEIKVTIVREIRAVEFAR
ncbi:MAG: ribonuclease Y [Zavarzinella sp.]